MWSADPSMSGSHGSARREVKYTATPIDHYALRSVLHEHGHVVVWSMRWPWTSGPHREGQKHRCLECERRSWRIAAAWVPFSRAMFERMRAALGTYRQGTPAPLETQRHADRQMGLVDWGLEHLRRMKWQARADKIARWKIELGRQRRSREKAQQNRRGGARRQRSELCTRSAMRPAVPARRAPIVSFCRPDQRRRTGGPMSSCAQNHAGSRIARQRQSPRRHARLAAENIPTTQHQRRKQQMPFGRWIPAIVSEYGITAAIQEYIEPARLDPKKDRIRLSALLKENRWTVELLDHAIATYGHPKPLGRTIGEGWDDRRAALFARADRPLARTHDPRPRANGFHDHGEEVSTLSRKRRQF